MKTSRMILGRFCVYDNKSKKKVLDLKICTEDRKRKQCYLDFYIEEKLFVSIFEWIKPELSFNLLEEKITEETGIKVDEYRGFYTKEYFVCDMKKFFQDIFGNLYSIILYKKSYYLYVSFNFYKE